jgi:hypothetical protein
MPRSGHKGEKMLETVAWTVLLMLSGAAIVVIVGVAIFMLSEEK